MATTIQQIELPKKARAVDTSGNNNHGQIYSGRGLEFDGVSDYLDIPLAFMNGATAISISLWFNTTESNSGMIAKYTSSSIYAWWINVEGGKLTANINSNKSNTSDLTTTVDVNNGNWHYATLTWSYSSGLASLYINGVLVDTDANTNETDLRTGSLNNTIGFQGYISSGVNTEQGGGYHQGLLSNVQIWDAVLTASDVAFAYANPESLALNNSGTALTESNLKLWYPMQDGHRGQQSYILDGANTGAGEELVTNGDFDTDSDWTKGTGWTISGGTANFTPNGSFINLTQSGILTSDKNYTVKYTLSNVTAGNVRARLGTQDGTTASSDGTYTGIITSNGSDFSIRTNGAFSGSVDNVSVKAINDKHHATTVFYGDELVTNGTFDTNITGWDSLGGWAFDSSQKAIHASGVSSDYLNKSGVLVVGRTYAYEVTTSGGFDGSNFIQIYSGGAHALYSNEAVQSGTFVATSTDFRIRGVSTNADIFIDNVSCKEVGVASGWTDADQQLHIPQTALQSYNELAWFDGEADYVTIADHDDLSFDAFSVSAWINMNDATNFAIASKGVYNSTGEWLFITEGADKLKLYIADESVLNCLIGRATAALTSKEGEWLHVVGTYDGGTASSGVKVYVNGVQSDEANAEVNPGSFVAMENLGGAVKVGMYSNHYANGSITETSLWDKELSSTEVLELFNDGKALDALTHSATANIKGYWRNNGLSTWTDLKGSNNGTPTNITETILIPQGVDSTRDAQGFIMNKQKDTSCLNLTSKSGGYVRVQDNSNVQLAGTAASWVFWVKLDSLSDGDQKLISKAASTGNPSSAYQIRTNSQQLLLQIYSGGWRSDARSSFFTSTDWVHVVVTIDGSNNVNFYKNGDVFGSEADIGYAVPANTGGLHIGIRAGAQGSTEFLKGQIDGVLLYNKELDSTEVLKNYNATKGNHRN